MNAQKIVGIAACALACVASANVLATDIDWFDGKVSDTTTSAISSPSNATWTVPATGVTTAQGSIALDNDKDSPLLLAPNAASAFGDGVVTLSSTAVLTPSDAADLADLTLSGAKAGFAVGIWDDSGVTKTNFYGYTSTGWIKLAGADVPDEAATSFKIVIDYRTGKKTVKYIVGTTQLYAYGEATTAQWYIADNTATELANVAAYGTGSLTALAATCEKAVAAVVDNETIRYGTIAEAIAAAGDDQTKIAVVGSDGTTGTANADAANGLKQWQCAALNIGESESIALQPSTTKAHGDKITLQLAVAPADGVTAKFGVKAENAAEATGSYDPDDIQVPMTTGKFTIVPTISAASN